MMMKSDKWGYRTGKSNLINLDNNDPSLYKRVLKKVPGLKSCLFCGSCSATCTASNDSMNFRKVINLLQCGEYSPLKELTRPCMLCGKCSLVCPRNIDTRSVIYNLKIMLHEHF
jgi:heterodisulfide reductase subunit C